MTGYRTQVKIVADVLSVARDFGDGESGVGITTILRKANIPYIRLVKLLKELVSAGLLIEIENGKGSRYRISENGINFLRTYSKFEEFARAYGLRL